MGMQRKIEIIESIQVGFDELREDPDLKNYANRDLRGLWSRKIKTSLCNAGSILCNDGRDWGYYVCANRVDFKFAPADKKIANHGEWLYDVTWIEYEENKEDGTPNPKSKLKEIPFVAECEWGNDQDVKEDFEKLLQARAGIRLMICNGWKRSNRNFSQEVAERLAKMVKAFNDSQSNDINLLATWERVGNRTDGDWKFRYFELGFGTFEPLERMC